MNMINKPVVRWQLVTWYLGMVAVLLACAISASPTATLVATEVEVVPLRLEDGAVKVQDEGGDWRPVGAETTFELVGQVESTNPWMVTGNTFAIRDSTQIAEGLEPGDVVWVSGVILEDNTWLANSIEPVEDETDPTITMIGQATSIDPWVVHGITLNVTSDTAITGEITPGTFVRVEILLEEDGSWEVLSIAPLGDFTEIPGCATIMARIASVDGNEIQFEGWPAIWLVENTTIEDEAGNEASLSRNQAVLVVVCAGENGQFVITKLIVLKPGDEGTSANGEKVLICHKPDKKGGHTLNVAEPAVAAHLAHGDKLGPCP